MNRPAKTRRVSHGERIDLRDEHALRHWTQSLGVRPQELRDAVSKVGPLVSDVRKALSPMQGRRMG